MKCCNALLSPVTANMHYFLLCSMLLPPCWRCTTGLKPMHSILRMPVRLWCLQPRCTFVAPHRVLAHTAMLQSTFGMLRLSWVVVAASPRKRGCLAWDSLTAARSLVGCTAWRMKQTAACRAYIFRGAPVMGWQNIRRGRTCTATAHAARAVSGVHSSYATPDGQDAGTRAHQST